MSRDEVTSVFKDQWNAYQWAVDNNLMGHHELLAAAQLFIQDRYKNSSVTMVDFGCGNSLLIPEMTRSVQLEYYFGIDLADNALAMASELLERSHIRSQQFCRDLFLGIPEIPSTPNLIYSAFAVHHGNEQKKRQFFSKLYQQAPDQCAFILTDIMIPPDLKFDEYTQGLEQYFIKQGIRSDWLSPIMAHIRQYDYPETAETWLDITRSSGWKVLHNQTLGPHKVYPATFMLLER
ncbi:class I SAM-dependent methyltransferase [Endozoicomonas gorgoniicola]|uniref:Class I SAM-dependent methyltransferase n=1 Tax=Endozoicomonas gorgoniicola TaxID=1234144 RepID=A0ABT3MVW7_9GAMM|nr:class I SAM-dependent methyltransferase [Endozoicomonas gorgoniicola]MCW7553520.1 class I SAM-dependent methyltransferase [Endozoicomonas gorgoniicola]